MFETVRERGQVTDEKAQSLQMGLLDGAFPWTAVMKSLGQFARAAPDGGERWIEAAAAIARERVRDGLSLYEQASAQHIRAAWDILGFAQADGRPTEGRVVTSILCALLDASGEACSELATVARTRITHELRSTGRVDVHAVRFIASVIRGGGGEHGNGVTRREAEWLLELDGFTTGEGNAPEWPDLFAQALVEHLCMALPDRGEFSDDLHLEYWKFKLRRLPAELTFDRQYYIHNSEFEQMGDRAQGERNERVQEAQAEASVLTLEERDWLSERFRYRKGPAACRLRERLLDLHGYDVRPDMPTCRAEPPSPSSTWSARSAVKGVPPVARRKATAFGSRTFGRRR